MGINRYYFQYPLAMRRLNFSCVFCLLLLFVFQIAKSQDVDHLRNERVSILNDIEKAKSQLKKKRSSRENTLQQLTLVTREVSLREDMLKALQADVVLLEKSIDNNQVQINNLEKEYAILVEEYAKLLQDTYLRSHALDELIYFLSAADFSVAYRRYRLLKEYSNYRRNQGQILKEKQLTLMSLQKDIRLQKEAKEAILGQLENEIAQLSSSKVEKSRLIENLQSEEQWLLRSIREKENQAKDLENKILDYIRTASVGTLGNDFSDFEGQLIWPVSKGVIVNRFGEHEHPILKNVSIKNNGIDIQSTSDDVVLAVHSGEVSRVVGIPGYNTAVLVRHGKYLTVYANLREVSVKQGQKVNAGQMVGRIFKEENSNMAILHFEIWHENQKLDPANWLIQ
jgi:septal ring factor EnvC (AmiA/AmiB activator)